jgi:hypothetical protein
VSRATLRSLNAFAHSLRLRTPTKYSIYPCGKSSAITRQCHSTLYPLPPSPLESTFRPLTVNHFSFGLSLAFFLFIYDMSQPSTSFQHLFSAALQEYENQTGCKLIEHPVAKQFKTCDSVESITAILQEQAQIFCKFRGDDGKLMKLLKSSVDILYTLSMSTVLREGIGLVHPRSSSG